MPATVTDERDVRLIHARMLHQVEPCVMRELQTRVWRQEADALLDALHVRVDRH